MDSVDRTEKKTMRERGWAGWLMASFLPRLVTRLRGKKPAPARLALLERIALAPRQSLALVEVDGHRFLVATAAEGAANCFPLDLSISGPAAREHSFRNTSALAAATQPSPFAAVLGQAVHSQPARRTVRAGRRAPAARARW